MSSKRLLATTLATLALAGTTTGVVMAATGGNSSSLTNLNGYPPHNMRIALSIGTGGSTSITGTGNVDVKHSALDVTLHLPLLITNETVELRAVAGKLYYTTSNMSQSSSAQWYGSSLSLPDLTPIALEFLHPDIALIKGASKTWVTTEGGLTVHHYIFAMGSALSSSALAGQQATITISTGTANELAAASISTTLDHQTVTAEITVLGYNDAPAIVAPARSGITPISGSALSQMLSQLAPGSLGTLLGGFAAGGASLGTKTFTQSPA
jgi:hypothetical protein